MYNLNGKASMWWQDLKITKKLKENDLKWDTLTKLSQEKYMFELSLITKSNISMS